MADDDIGGVWRTVGGRRIFIKDQSDLVTAMRKEFGDKKNKKNDVKRILDEKQLKKEVEDAYKNGTLKELYEKYGKAIVEKEMSNKYEKFQKQEVKLEKVKERGNLKEDEAKECVKLAEGVYKKAEGYEPKITKDLVDTAKKYGATMYGLDFRMKQPTSMAGKIGADVKDDKLGRLTFVGAADDIKDAVRYTAILNDKYFVSQYNAIKSDLGNKGYTEVRCKNFWQMYNDGQANQKAVQCVYANKDGYKFEFQYHTIDSQGAKELNHPLYEEARNKTTSDIRREDLNKTMKYIGGFVSDPPDIYKIISH